LFLGNHHRDLGLLLWETGRPAEAEVEYRTAIAICRNLAEANPAVTEFRNSLALAHNNLGYLLNQAGRAAEAETELQRSLVIRRGLAEGEPGNPGWQRQVGMSLTNLADLDTVAGRLDAAIARFRESVALHERLAGAYPTVIDYRSGLAFGLTGLGRALHRAGRPNEAAGPLRRAAVLRGAIPHLSLEARFDLARGLALLASASDSHRGPDTGWADRATDALRRALAAGFRDDPARIRNDPDLAVLRGRADFQLLLLDLTMPADPFAPAH
jgi:tetratricopeptide (TPR) repeat protein